MLHGQQAESIHPWRAADKPPARTSHAVNPIKLCLGPLEGGLVMTWLLYVAALSVSGATAAIVCSRFFKVSDRRPRRRLAAARAG
jgi:hypothetical protein